MKIKILLNTICLIIVVLILLLISYYALFRPLIAQYKRVSEKQAVLYKSIKKNKASSKDKFYYIHHESIIDQPLKFDKIMADLSEKENIYLNKIEYSPIHAIGNLYEHAAKITFSSNYSTFLSFLNDINNQPYFILWRKIKYNVSKYPNANIELTVGMLSHDDQ